MMFQKEFQVMLKLLPGLILCCQMIAASSTVVKNKICREIEEILLRRFSSSHVEVINQSYDVNGIKPEDDPELASFLRVIVVSSKFENKTLIYSHMQVTQALNEEGVYEKVHSIQILTKTPEQWKKDKEKKKKEEEEKRKEEEKKKKEEEKEKKRKEEKEEEENSQSPESE